MNSLAEFFLVVIISVLVGFSVGHNTGEMSVIDDAVQLDQPTQEVIYDGLMGVNYRVEIKYLREMK